MRTYLIPFLIVFSLLAACTGTATSQPELPTQVPTPVSSPTPSTPLVILILPADLPQDELNEYQTLIYNLAQLNGMRFQLRNTLSVPELQAELPALKVVIALPPDPGLAVLLAAAPDVQFLAVKIRDLTLAPNLSIIGGEDQPVDKQAFLAGYIAGMLAPEWRVGILSERDTPGGESARTAFTNGYHYFCGYCVNPGHFNPPYHEYPIVVRIPTDAKLGEYTGYAAALLDYLVKVVYVYPSVATPEVLSYLADYGAMLVGQELTDEDVRSNWITSIQPDIIPAIQNIFPALVAGQGGQQVPTPLYLTDVNGNLLTEGKLRLAQEVLDGLQNGTIGTGVTP